VILRGGLRAQGADGGGFLLVVVGVVDEVEAGSGQDVEADGHRVILRETFQSHAWVRCSCRKSAGMLLWMSSQVTTRLRPFLDGHCLPALIGVNVVHARCAARAPR